MTRKHFQAIADALKFEAPPTAEHNDAGLQQWTRDVRAMADVCSGFNGNFDRQRFLAACGLH